MTTKYGKNPEQWERNISIATGALRAVAAGRGTTTYKHLARMVGSDVDHWREMAHILGEVVRREHAESHPLVSAVVVRIDDKKPGVGFAGIARNLGIDIAEGDEVVFWMEQLLKSWDYWSS